MVTPPIVLHPSLAADYAAMVEAARGKRVEELSPEVREYWRAYDAWESASKDHDERGPQE